MRLGVAIVLAALAIATGCKTKEMKTTPFYEGDESAYTGRVEDRVNLWPIAYWREPACSIAWPVVSFSDDHFALRPLYSQYRQGGRGTPYDEYNFVWPLGQADFGSGDYTAFPFFWGEGYFALFPEVFLADGLAVVLPFMMNSSNMGSSGAVLPVLWWAHEPDERAFTLFPLYSYSWAPGSMRLWGACGLFGNLIPDSGEYAHWLLPFYFANRDGVFSIPWSRTDTFDGDVVDLYMCGLGGRTTAGGKYSSSWAFPIYYHETDSLLTPFFGWGEGSDWIMPLYYRDVDSFFTLPYASWDDSCDGTSGFLALPLFTWATWSTNSCRSSWCTLGGLVGARSDATGERRRSWAFPLYDSNAGKSFSSLLYGWSGGGTSCTNTWWATPFVGTCSGDRTGWWAFPLCDSWKDADFERLHALPDAPTLPSGIGAMKRFCAEDGIVVLLTKHAHAVKGAQGYGTESNKYEIVSLHEFNTCLVYESESRRRAKYDMGTGKKISDSDGAEASFAWPLYAYERDTDLMSGKYARRHNVLWKLWDWEEKDGDVRLDVFPFFTYDDKANGYTKSAFLWRFFRYESDPAGGTAADFLFIPVWR